MGKRFAKLGGAITCGFGAVAVFGIGSVANSPALKAVAGGIAVGGVVMLKQAFIPPKKKERT